MNLIQRAISKINSRINPPMNENLSAAVAQYAREKPKNRLSGFGKYSTRNAGFEAASSDRMFWDWEWTIRTIDELIRWALRKMRSRARDLELNNDYVRGFLDAICANVVGHHGFDLQPRLRKQDGTPDDLASKQIKEAWKAWGKAKNCTVTTTDTWQQALMLGVRTLARDGEVLIRKVRGYPNEFGFAIEVIVPDALDEQLINTLPNGNKIFCGVEFDKYRKPVNYYLRKAYNEQMFFYSELSGIGQHEIVPASDIIHVFIKYRADQSRGIPWTHAAMTRLKMIGAYEEAELMAARVMASKMAMLKRKAAEDPTDAGITQTDAGGETLGAVEPGMIWNMPDGYELDMFDPAFPQKQYGEFIRACLRGISAGLPTSYATLSKDLENVNYSSIREGKLAEQEVYKILQKFLTEVVCENIYCDWLPFALLTPYLKGLNPKFLDRYQAGAHFHGRRWPWVDPQKDYAAIHQELEDGVTTRQAILSERGGAELEEIYEQLAYENDLAKKHDLPFDKIPWEAIKNPNSLTTPPVPLEDDPADGKPKPKTPAAKK
jgi:lambda family phage portal protein